jgi:hypothetical protein
MTEVALIGAEPRGAPDTGRDIVYDGETSLSGPCR